MASNGRHLGLQGNWVSSVMENLPLLSLLQYTAEKNSIDMCALHLRESGHIYYCIRPPCSVPCIRSSIDSEVVCGLDDLGPLKPWS